MPLCEITTEPDIHHPEDATKLVHELCETLRHLKISNARPENGEIRMDTNISLTRKSDGLQGPRIEVKSIERFEDVEAAIDFEVVRQHECFSLNQKSQDRTWDPIRQDTVFLRTKTEQDYLFMRDPDLPRLSISKERIQRQAEGISLPIAKKLRLLEEFQLSVPQMEKAFQFSEGMVAFELLAASRDS